MLIARRDMVSKVSVATDILVTKGYSNFNDPKNPRALITLDSVKATNGAISEALRIRDKGCLVQSRDDLWDDLWDLLCNSSNRVTIESL